MLPDDPEFHSDDGNEEITHDFVNAIERSVDAVKGSGSDCTFPAPTGTALPWGGGRMFLFQHKAGFTPGLKLLVDDSIDFRNRIITVLAAGYYNAANAMPGEGAYGGAGSMGMILFPDFSSGCYYTEDGATDGDPPGGGANYLTLKAADVYLYADSANDGALTLRNGSAGTTFYPFLLLIVSDQFPTRT